MKYIPVKLLNVFLIFGDTPLAVGRLALVQRKIYFEYSPSFIASGLEISPAKLPLQSGAKAPATQNDWSAQAKTAVRQSVCNYVLHSDIAIFLLLH